MLGKICYSRFSQNIKQLSILLKKNFDQGLGQETCSFKRCQ